MSNKPTSFAQAYQELQALTKDFETSNLDLEKSIPKYKRATQLAAFLKQQLTQIENQIEEIDTASQSKTDQPTPKMDTQDIDF